MMLTEQTPVPEAALPVAAFRDHLQLGSGFSDDGVQDPVLATCLRAAMAAIEAQTDKALLTRTFQYEVSAWRDIGRQELPIAPVASVSAFSVTDLLGNTEAIGTEAYRLVPDFYRPVIIAKGWSLPVIPTGGTAAITFEAGFGSAWDDVPADIGQAVLMLAAHFYDNRSAMAVRGKALPHGIESLVRRYRPMRILGGGK